MRVLEATWKQSLICSSKGECSHNSILLVDIYHLISPTQSAWSQQGTLEERVPKYLFLPNKKSLHKDMIVNMFQTCFWLSSVCKRIHLFVEMHDAQAWKTHAQEAGRSSLSAHDCNTSAWGPLQYCCMRCTATAPLLGLHLADCQLSLQNHHFMYKNKTVYLSACL